MAKVQGNLITKGMEGQLGDQLVFRTLNGQTIVSTKGQPTGTPSAAQLAQREAFGDRVAWASAHKGDQEYLDASSANKQKFPSAFQAAMSDALTDPDYVGGRHWIGADEEAAGNTFLDADALVIEINVDSITIDHIDVSVYEYASDPAGGGVTPSSTHSTAESAVLAARPDGLGDDVWQFDVDGFMTTNVISHTAGNFIGLGLVIVDKYGNSTTLNPHEAAHISAYGTKLAALVKEMA